MVGRPVALDVTKAPPALGDVLLTVKGLNIHDHTGRNLVKDISFELRAGEVLAVAGVQGNGQSELAEAIVGLQEHVTGEINLDGVDLSRSSVRQALHAGIAFVPESREEDGLISSFSIEENLILDLHDLPPFARGLVISQDEVVSNAAKRVAEFDIRAQSPKDPASSLSGGNKQKVVLARELSRPVKLVVASQPTRGLDVGSIEFVHERIIAERDSGRGVLLFSTELDEVVALADRIAVMYRGEFIAIVPTSTSREELGLLMAGIKR
jgi:simple sugar transport system ATP-binding protein